MAIELIEFRRDDFGVTHLVGHWPRESEIATELMDESPLISKITESNFECIVIELHNTRALYRITERNAQAGTCRLKLIGHSWN